MAIEDVRTAASGVPGGQKRPVAGQKLAVAAIFRTHRWPGSVGPENDALWRFCEMVFNEIGPKSAFRPGCGADDGSPISICERLSTVPFPTPRDVRRPWRILALASRRSTACRVGAHLYDGTVARYHIVVNARQQRTLQRIFSRPTPSDMRWTEIEALLVAAGVEVTERAGSRVGLKKDNERMVVHRPHPQPEVGKATVRAIARFLAAVGVQP